MKPFLITSLVLLLFGGCRKETDDVLPADPSRLVGKWRLMNGPANYTITMTISPMAMTGPGPMFLNQYGISGKGPVNTYGGLLDYAPRGDSTRAGEIRITDVARGSKVGESAEAAQATDRYFNQLADVYSYGHLSNGQLRLIYGASNGFSAPSALIYQRQ